MHIVVGLADALCNVLPFTAAIEVLGPNMESETSATVNVGFGIGYIIGAATPSKSCHYSDLLIDDDKLFNGNHDQNCRRTRNDFKTNIHTNNQTTKQKIEKWVCLRSHCI